jgi:hypothetical protein
MAPMEQEHVPSTVGGVYGEGGEADDSVVQSSQETTSKGPVPQKTLPSRTKNTPVTGSAVPASTYVAHVTPATTGSAVPALTSVAHGTPARVIAAVRSVGESPVVPVVARRTVAAHTSNICNTPLLKQRDVFAALHMAEGNYFTFMLYSLK